ncbi:hypothetical protein E4U21_001633 [Claviceps maximensis]|nr:hypothetical protein E4U21_001633 [Claviceps maximensis]
MENQAIELQGVANFRDVGQTVNRFLDRNTELIKQAQKIARQSERISSISSYWFTPRPTLPRIHGIDYQEIKITGRAFEMHLLRQLPWWSLLKVIFFSILGYRIPAIRIMAAEVMLSRGLVGLGIDTLDLSGLEIKRALSLYVTKDSLPILVHCTQGKDRTGLIIILILMILGTPLDAIEHDYFLTNPALEAERPQLLSEVREVGLTDEWVRTSPNMIRGLQKHLELKYGGLEAYLDGIGFDAGMRIRLRAMLVY